MYDTHAHLDLFLKKSGFWPNLREEEPVEELLINPKNLEDYALPFGKAEQDFIEKSLEKHNWIVQPTVSSYNFLQAWQLIFNPKISLLLGSHPEIVQTGFNLQHYLEFQNKVVDFIQSKTEIKSRLLGIGECGLDYFYSQESQIIATQKELFISQINLALKLDIPLIIHCRDAFHDLFEILEQFPAIHGKFLIHCFTGNLNEAKKIVQLGGKMALGGILTFSSAKQLVEAVRGVNIQHFVLETDLPFLAPNPFRGKICTPEMVEFSLQKLAELKEEEPAYILETTKTTAEKFFKISV